MFTDIVDSTPLVEAIGDEAWVDLVRWHDGTLRGLFAGHSGEEVDHAGDGFFVAFGRARDALDCAVGIQRTLAEHRRREGFSPRVRIGIHACPAIRRGRGYRGMGVHVAARISSEARGGEIVISRETLEQAGTSLRVSDRRAAILKGLGTPVDVVTVHWE
jgi:class 3 adenylate cyclase